MKENHFLDDGAYSAVQIIIETVRRRLAGEGDIAVELLKDLKEPKDASEFRMKITVRMSLNVSCMQHKFTCASKPVCLISHIWLHVPNCKV